MSHSVGKRIQCLWNASLHISIFNRFWDIASYWWKIATFSYPNSLPEQGVTPSEFREDLDIHKTRMNGLSCAVRFFVFLCSCVSMLCVLLCVLCVCSIQLHSCHISINWVELMFSRFDTIPACDRWTNRRTDGIPIYRFFSVFFPRYSVFFGIWNTDFGIGIGYRPRTTTV